MAPSSWKRVGILAAALVALGGGGVAAAAEPGGATGGLVAAALTLDKAVAAGALAVEGRNPRSAQRIELVLASRSQEPLTVDVSGRHLRPTGGRRLQRLGLAHPVGPVTPDPDQAPGVFAVTLQPGETRRLLMNSCCMDLGLPDPKPSDRYVLATEPTPAPVEACLRWWVQHPDAKQEVVNQAIWESNPALLDVIERGVPSAPPCDRARSVGRTLHLLSGEDLLTVDVHGVRRVRATGVRQVFPSPLVLHALLGGGDLARLPADDGAPERLFPLGEPVLDLWSVPRGPFVWRTARGVFVRSPDVAATVQVFSAEASGHCSLAPADLLAGRFVLVDVRHVPEKGPRFDVHDLDARTGGVERRRSFWNLRDMAAGPGGVFALSPNGRLLRLRDGRLEASTGPRALRRIVVVGRHRLVAEGEGRQLVAVTPGSADAVALGIRAEDPSAPEAVPNAAFDPVTDDLVWVVDRSIRRLPSGSDFAEGIATFPRRGS